MEDEYLRSYAIKYLDNGENMMKYQQKIIELKSCGRRRKKKKSCIYTLWYTKILFIFERSFKNQKKETILEDPNIF